MNKALLFLNILFSCSSIEKRWREVVYNKTPSCQVTAILSSGSTVAVFWQHEDIPKLVEAGSWWTSCWCTLKACMYVNHMEWQGGVSQLYTGMFGFGEFNSQDLRYVIYCCAFSYRIAFFFSIIATLWDLKYQNGQALHVPDREKHLKNLGRTCSVVANHRTRKSQVVVLF